MSACLLGLRKYRNPFLLYLKESLYSKASIPELRSIGPLCTTKRTKWSNNQINLNQNSCTEGMEAASGKGDLVWSFQSIHPSICFCFFYHFYTSTNSFSAKRQHFYSLFHLDIWAPQLFLNMSHACDLTFYSFKTTTTTSVQLCTVNQHQT